MQIGDSVVVVNNDLTYSTRHLHKEYGCENYVPNKSPKEGEEDYNESMRVFKNLKVKMGELIERGVHETIKNRWKTIVQSLEYAICNLSIEEINKQLRLGVNYYLISLRESGQEYLLVDDEEKNC